MTRRIRLLWKVLLAFFVVCALSSLAAWAILLTTICSNPRTPMPETQHVIAYNCHGMTVFISPLQDAMRLWLIPVEVLFIFLSLLAAAMVLLSAANVRIDVQIQIADKSGRIPKNEGGRD
jgi:Na+-transporting methylmalonyl-CoA/oxaloacetate decarboxylase gamma subunit